MKIAKWIVLGLVVLIIVALTIAWLSINGIVRRTVETQATNSLNVQTTLGSANVSLLGGSLGLRDLQIASPQGFEAPRMFTLGGLDVGVSLGRLRGDPIGIDRIVIDKPRLVVEQSQGKFNFKVLMDQQSKQPSEGGKEDQGQPMRLIIHDLAVNDAQVVLRPGIPGLAKEINVPVPSFNLKEIGSGEGNKNGVAIKQVVMLVVTSLAQKASQSDLLPGDVKQLLSLNVDQVKEQVQAEVNKQLGKITQQLGNALPPEAGKDAGKALEKGLGGLLKGTDNKKTP